MIAGNSAGPEDARGFTFPDGLERPSATVHLATRSVRVRLVRASTELLELAAEEVGLEQSEASACTLSVADAGVTDVEGQLHHVDGTVLFRFDAPSPTTAARIFALSTELHADEATPPPASSERIVEARGIETIVRGLIVNRAASRIRAQERDWLLSPQALEGDRIVWAVVEQGAGAFASPLVIESSGYSASYELPVLLAEENGGVLRTTIPRQISRTRRRRMPRVSVRGQLTVEFTHPTYGFTITHPVVDVSEDGIGIHIDAADALCPGLTMPELRLSRDGTLVCRLSGQIRTVHRTQSSAGLSVQPLHDSDSRLWGRYVRELLHERTRSWDYDADEIWDLYEAAGYLNLSGKSPADFVQLKASFVDATKRLARAPEVGYHVLWPSERGVDAAVTNVLTYSRAHLGYQMAKRPGRVVNGAIGKEMLRDIHWHTLEEALASSRSDWWIGYVQAETRFSNLLFVEFQSRFRNPVKECVVPFRPYQIPCTDSTTEALAIATQAEVETICATIRATRPEPYWKSQDLSPELMNLEQLRGTWARVGLQRERVVLVAREAGTLKAALIADLAHPGLHIYGLMDVTRFFPVSSDGDQYLNPLLEMAKLWFASFGRTQFTHFHEGAAPLQHSAGMVDMGAASCCVISMDLIPDLLDYLFEQMNWDPKDSMPPPGAVNGDSRRLSLVELAAAS